MIYTCNLALRNALIRSISWYVIFTLFDSFGLAYILLATFILLILTRPRCLPLPPPRSITHFAPENRSSRLFQKQQAFRTPKCVIQSQHSSEENCNYNVRKARRELEVNRLTSIQRRGRKKTQIALMSHATPIFGFVFLFFLPVHEERACNTTWRVELALSCP